MIPETPKPRNTETLKYRNLDNLKSRYPETVHSRNSRLRSDLASAHGKIHVFSGRYGSRSGFVKVMRAVVSLDFNTMERALLRCLIIKAEPGLKHAVKRVVFEEISLLDIGGERRVTLMAAELLQLSRVDPPVFGGIHGTAL